MTGQLSYMHLAQWIIDYKYLMSDGLVVVLSSEIWEDKVPGDCFEECGGSVCLGA